MSSEFATKAGRGGAGNFHSKKDLENSLTRNEVRFHRSPPSDESHKSLTSQWDLAAGNQARLTGEASMHRQTHIRKGRGGAGNFVDLNDSSASSSSASDPAPTASTASTSAPISTVSIASTVPTASIAPPKPESKTEEESPSNSAVYRGRSGRGGAGNWMSSVQVDEEERRKREGEREEVVRERVRIDVEEGLRRPPRCYKGGAERVE